MTLDNNLNFGYAKAEITPPLRLPMEGYEERLMLGGGSLGVHDSLYARILYLRADADLCLVALDLCLLMQPEVDQLRCAVSRCLNLPYKQVQIVCIHTHSGPVTGTVWKEEVPCDPELVHAYLQQVTEAVCAASLQAKALLAPASVYRTTASVAASYNRRCPQPDGSTKLVFSLWEHPTQRPSGLVDNDIPVIVFERRNRDAFGQSGPQQVILYSAAMHPVTLGKHNRLISADYPGEVARIISGQMPHTEAIFLPGCCGNTQPLCATQYSAENLKIIGGAVAYSVMAALYRKADVTEEKTCLDVAEKSSPREFTYGTLRMTSFLLCGTYFSFVSAECFVSMQHRLKAWAKRPAVIATLSNGWIGYVPDREAFAQGGYEINNALDAGVLPDTMDAIVETVTASWKKIEESEDEITENGLAAVKH